MCKKQYKKIKLKSMKTNYLLIILLATITFSCTHKTEEKDECCKKEKNVSKTELSISDESIFNIESDWKTQNDATVKLESFKGKITVLAMIFTHCQSACPRIVADLQRIENEIPKDQLKDVQFVLVTMDPLRDTPKRLKEFASEHNINESRWTLLTSNEDDALVFANVIGMKYKKTEDGGFDHSNIINILDKKNHPVFLQIFYGTIQIIFLKSALF